jgi:hypothetical protein
MIGLRGGGGGGTCCLHTQARLGCCSTCHRKCEVPFASLCGGLKGGLLSLLCQRNFVGV